MLAERKMVYDVYGNDEESLKQYKYKLPADYKKEHTWLKDVDSLALANAQMHLTAAYRNFYRSPSTGFPKFKSKHNDKRSYTTNNQKGTIRITSPNTIRLPKLKDIKIKIHRPIPEGQVIKSATISLTSTWKYYISILVEYEKEIEPIIPVKEKILGLDYSSGMLYVDSDGNNAGYPGYYRKAEERLKKEQRKLSKRSKGGKNRDKQREKVARLHEKVANQRKDFLHKISKQIANAYDGVAVENLNMRAMARGLHLAKSTNDNGFGQLRSMLAYKLQEQGKQMVVIDKWYPSSKRCHNCGNDYKELSLRERSWTCRYCNTVHNRDENAAINIKNEGCRILGIA
jgi:putative transposase